MARGLTKALARTGYNPVLASRLQIYDSKGDLVVQSALREKAKQEIARILKDPPKWTVWVSYHSYYKSPDLIGPAVSGALSIPYVQIESTRARKRLAGPWAGFAQAAEAASDCADSVLYMTEHDRKALEAYAPEGQRLVHLPPFLAVEELPERAAPLHNSILSIGMFRSRAKLASYQLIAETLPKLTTPDWQLTIIGDGPERDTIKALFAGFGESVTFTGALEPVQISAHLAASKVLFWPGVDEAYGMVYLEAQAAGVPVVAQDRAGVRDVLARQGCNPDEGPQAMSAQLDRLLSDAAYHKDAAAQARDRVGQIHLLPQAAEVLRQTLGAVI
jgi:glycosyltransferase involved in cell wall biosynthesis